MADGSRATGSPGQTSLGKRRSSEKKNKQSPWREVPVQCGSPGGRSTLCSGRSRPGAEVARNSALWLVLFHVVFFVHLVFLHLLGLLVLFHVVFLHIIFFHIVFFGLVLHLVLLRE